MLLVKDTWPVVPGPGAVPPPDPQPEPASVLDTTASG
jgi:hypothetical protein